MAAKIILDAGHGGFDSGAVHNGRREKDDNLALTLAVGSILKSRGFDVVYTRTDDVYQSPVDKARLGNESGADYFISFHRNSSPVPNTYSGTQVLVYSKGGVREELANNINSQLEQTGFNNLGVSVRPDLAVLRRTNMPAVLIETGFINTDADNTRFDNEFSNIAEAIANGITMTVGEQPSGSRNYRIQVGLFSDYQNAVNLQYQLINEGYMADVVNLGEYYGVFVGNYSDYDAARAAQEALNEKGYQTLIVER